MSLCIHRSDGHTFAMFYRLEASHRPALMGGEDYRMELQGWGAWGPLTPRHTLPTAVGAGRGPWAAPQALENICWSRPLLASTENIPGPGFIFKRNTGRKPFPPGSASPTLGSRGRNAQGLLVLGASFQGQSPQRALVLHPGCWLIPLWKKPVATVAG